MKSILGKKEYQKIYNTLNSVTPLDMDCGELCGSACCMSRDEDMGIYLLPGEDIMISDAVEDFEIEIDDAEEYEFPDSWTGDVYFVKCKDPLACNRFYRPVQCKIYPLEPHIREEKLILILSSVETPYKCPLIERKIRLNPDFVETVYKAWEKLIEDPLIYDLILFDSSTRKNYLQVYPEF